jgi:hypothetical protein
LRLAAAGSSRSALGETRQNEDRQVGRARLDRGERVDAALVGHRQVHDEDVDVALADDVDRLAAVRRLGDDLKVDLVGEVLAQPGANDGVVVDDGDSDHGVVTRGVFGLGIGIGV